MHKQPSISAAWELTTQQRGTMIKDQLQAVYCGMVWTTATMPVHSRWGICQQQTSPAWPWTQVVYLPTTFGVCGVYIVSVLVSK